MALPSYILGKKQVLLTTTVGVDRIITDYDEDGYVEVLTVVSKSRKFWRLFADGSTQGDDLPFITIVGEARGRADTPTKPETPSSMPPKDRE